MEMSRSKWISRGMILLIILLFIRSETAAGEEEFQFLLPRAIRSYSENCFALKVPEAGFYRITIHDETTIYRILEGEIREAGRQDVLWDGAGFNEERLDQRRYTIDASFDGISGALYRAQLSHTVGYTYQAVNFALPSSATLNLNCPKEWFIELKTVMDGTLTVEWVPEKAGLEKLTAFLPVKGGKVKQVSLSELMKSRLPGTGVYSVHVFDQRNPEYGKSFRVQVTDAQVPDEPLFLTGEILPPDDADESTMWNWMMKPSVVVDIGFHQHQKILKEPELRSESLGTVHGQTQGMKVLDLSVPGWARVGAWNHETGEYVEGWVPQDKLKVVHPETDYGLVFRKSDQSLTVYFQGNVLDTLRISTGKAEKKHADYETPAGAYLTGTHRGSFSSNGKKFDYVIQYDGGNMIHQIPYWWKNGLKDFSAGAEALGTKASHGCIRVQAEPSGLAGINAYWLWTHIPFGSRVIILEG